MVNGHHRLLDFFEYLLVRFDLEPRKELCSYKNRLHNRGVEYSPDSPVGGNCNPLVGLSLQPIWIYDRWFSHICRSYGDIPA